jgi:hypothetical protein
MGASDAYTGERRYSEDSFLATDTMQTRMIGFIVVLSLLGMAQGTRSERVVEALNQLCTAMLQENYVRAVDLMHPKVIQYFGGREKAIAAFKSAAESTKAEGLVPTAQELAFPLGFGLAVLTSSRSCRQPKKEGFAGAG